MMPDDNSILDENTSSSSAKGVTLRQRKYTPEQKMDIILQQNSELLKQNGAILRQLANMKVNMKAKDDKIDNLCKKVFSLEAAVDTMLAKSTESNIVVKGVKADNNADALQKIKQIHGSLNPPRPSSFYSARVIGKNKNIIIVKTNNVADKRFFFFNSKQLLEKGVRIDDDLPPRLRKIKNSLLMKRRELIDAGTATKVKIFTSSLLVDDKIWYDFDRAGDVVVERQQQ
jgi:hypothetical protein